MCDYKFDRQQMYGIYMPLSEWAELIEILTNHPEHIGFAEYIGDEIGILLSAKKKDLAKQEGCYKCVHRGECVIKANKPICRQYMTIRLCDKP